MTDEERESKLAELNTLMGQYRAMTQYVHVAQSTIRIRPSHLVDSFARDLTRFPHENFEELCESIKNVGLLEPIMIRVIPILPTPKEGDRVRFEVISGHARRDALKKLGMDEEIEVRVMNWDDGQVLKAMSALLPKDGDFAPRTIEIVRATVLAHAEERIDLGPIPEGTPESEIMYAPSFVPGQKQAGWTVEPAKKKENE